MEEGRQITITPKRGKYLKYQLQDGQFVTSEKSVVPNPGGPKVSGSFERTFRAFMSGQAQAFLARSRFLNKIEDAMIIKRKLMIPRINSGMVADAAMRARNDSDNIADGVTAIYA